MLSAFTRVSAIAILFAAALFAQPVSTPIPAAVRLNWLLRENVSPAALLENVAIGAENTLTNRPKEYGPHWEGFAKRTGMVTANYGVQTSLEAGLGSIWGEDPRYVRTEGGSFVGRVGYVVRMTFSTRNRAGNIVPAYARLASFPAASFLANAWMPDSEANVGGAFMRAGVGFLSRMSENAWKEFRPRR